MFAIFLYPAPFLAYPAPFSKGSEGSQKCTKIAYTYVFWHFHHFNSPCMHQCEFLRSQKVLNTLDKASTMYWSDMRVARRLIIEAFLISDPPLYPPPPHRFGPTPHRYTLLNSRSNGGFKAFVMVLRLEKCF